MMGSGNEAGTKVRFFASTDSTTKLEPLNTWWCKKTMIMCFKYSQKGTKRKLLFFYLVAYLNFGMYF
jgi:hypothetical protein